MNYGMSFIKADYWVCKNELGNTIFQEGRGTAYWLCNYCSHTKGHDFDCDCIPESATYCWKCKKQDCEHKQELLSEWEILRPKKIKKGLKKLVLLD